MNILAFLNKKKSCFLSESKKKKNLEILEQYDFRAKCSPSASLHSLLCLQCITLTEISQCFKKSTLSYQES